MESRQKLRISYLFLQLYDSTLIIYFPYYQITGVLLMVSATNIKNWRQMLLLLLPVCVCLLVCFLLRRNFPFFSAWKKTDVLSLNFCSSPWPEANLKMILSLSLWWNSRFWTGFFFQLRFNKTIFRFFFNESLVYKVTKNVGSKILNPKWQTPRKWCVCLCLRYSGLHRWHTHASTSAGTRKKNPFSYTCTYVCVTAVYTLISCGYSWVVCVNRAINSYS